LQGFSLPTTQSLTESLKAMGKLERQRLERRLMGFPQAGGANSPQGILTNLEILKS